MIVLMSVSCVSIAVRDVRQIGEIANTFGEYAYEPNVTWTTVPDAIEVTTEWIDTPEGTASLWVSFPEFTSSVTITVELRKSTQSTITLGAGVLVVGPVETFPDPRIPLSEGLIDYSITRELSNGATYYKARDRVRKFSGEILVRRDTYFQEFMSNFARVFGMTPVMILIAEEMGNDFVIYGRLMSMPNGSHITRDYSTISFEIIEVI